MVGPGAKIVRKMRNSCPKFFELRLLESANSAFEGQPAMSLCSGRSSASVEVYLGPAVPCRVGCVESIHLI